MKEFRVFWQRIEENQRKYEKYHKNSTLINKQKRERYKIDKEYREKIQERNRVRSKTKAYWNKRREWEKKNREKVLQGKREEYRRNIEKYHTYEKKPERKKKKNYRHKIWYQKNKEKIKNKPKTLDDIIRLRNKDKRRKRDRTKISLRNQEIKYEVFSHYSKGKMICNCCGETFYPFLTLDHMLDKPKRKGIYKTRRNGSIMLYRWLKRNNYPEGYQILCMNCNFAKRMRMCPHQKNKMLADVQRSQHFVLS